MQKKWSFILFALCVTFCSFAQARTSIVVSIGQNMYMNPNYQLRQQLRANRMQNRLIRAQIAEMQLRNQLRRIPQPEYIQPYYFIDEPFGRRIVYARPTVRRCHHHICAR